MSSLFSKIKLGNVDLFVLCTVLVGLILLIMDFTRAVSTLAAKTKTDEFRMEIDPDRVIVDQTPMLPEINILTRQTIFFKNDQGIFIPKKDSQPLIVNTCDQSLEDLRLVWHISTGLYNGLPKGADDFMELCHALEDLDILDSTKAHNQGNWVDISPSTLLPGESAPITAFSTGILQALNESGFTRGQLYVVADAVNGAELKMVYGFELEPLAFSQEAIVCQIFELTTIESNLSGPKR